MTPTHQTKDADKIDAVCWRFLQGAPMPGWVFRAFHNLGNPKELVHRSGYRVKEGQWIVADVAGASCFVLTDEEFHLVFREIPEHLRVNHP